MAQQAVIQSDAPQFDAIVVGSGISGGWAAKEFAEKGLKTLVIERGRSLEHGTDYAGENRPKWDFKFRDSVPPSIAKRDYAVQSTCYAFKESTQQFFINDRENPYSTSADMPFSWIRGDQVGGRSITWGRQTYRMSDLDFEANKKDGHGVDWPIRYKDIAPWYDYVETFVGISGAKDNIPHVPDGVFLPPVPMNCVEEDIKAKIEARFADRKMINGRCANLTKPTEAHLDLGRGSCQFRNQCERGCSFGASFSSQSATLPAAERTGNLTLMTDMAVESVIYDAGTGRATGVRTFNRRTGARAEHTAKVIFLCASTVGTLQIMLNSRSARYPHGLGNTHDVLGRYIMDHHHRIGGKGRHLQFQDRYFSGRRPTSAYIPRFRNIGNGASDFVRGYAFQAKATRESWKAAAAMPGAGAGYKNALRTPADWTFGLIGFGEMLPYAQNRVTLHKTKTEASGVPQVHIDCKPFDNEKAMRADMVKTSREIMESAGLVDVETYDYGMVPGECVHEMGGAPMGRDPRTSILNAHNQCHDIPNLFVTDGSVMTSGGCQNPSITYMALTARAVDHAVTLMKAGAL